MDQNGDGNPLGGAFVGERVSEVCWEPNDSALAAMMRKVVLMYGDLKFDNRTEKRSVETASRLWEVFMKEQHDDRPIIGR